MYFCFMNLILFQALNKNVTEVISTVNSVRDWPQLHWVLWLTLISYTSQLKCKFEYISVLIMYLFLSCWVKESSNYWSNISADKHMILSPRKILFVLAFMNSLVSYTFVQTQTIYLFIISFRGCTPSVTSQEHPLNIIGGYVLGED